MNDEHRTHYRLSEIAAMTGLSKSFLRACVNEGRLKGQRFVFSNKTWLVASEDLETFLAANLVPVRDE